MNFSVAWDEQYRANAHMSVWPWTDLVCSVMRYAKPAGPGTRVLELGCGAGANIPFFKSLGAEYYAVDGSPFIIEKLQTAFPELSGRLAAADFTREIPFDQEFDLIVDRAGLTCNSTISIQNTLKMVYERLKPNGKYIGIDWYSREQTMYENREDIDAYTHNFHEGPFSETGPVHFSDKRHMFDLFKAFDIISLVHKAHKQILPDENVSIASWDIVAQKRKAV